MDPSMRGMPSLPLPASKSAARMAARCWRRTDGAEPTEQPSNHTTEQPSGSVLQLGCSWLARGEGLIGRNWRHWQIDWGVDDVGLAFGICTYMECVGMVLSPTEAVANTRGSRRCFRRSGGTWWRDLFRAETRMINSRLLKLNPTSFRTGFGGRPGIPCPIASPDRRGDGG